MWDMGECKRDGVINSQQGQFPPLRRMLLHKESWKNGQIFTSVRDGKERALCRYQGSKNIMQEQSLKDKVKFEELRRRGIFQLNWKDGFDYVVEEEES